jgi:AraC-like DNA-binding protein
VTRALKVPATGTRRRLRALAYLGHGIPELALLFNAGPELIDRILHTRVEEIDPYLRVRVAAMFDRCVGDSPLPLCLTVGDDQTMRDYARGLHWHSVLSWWDVDIDDPKASPNRRGVEPGQRKPRADKTRQEDIVRLIVTGGMSAGGHQKDGFRQARDEAALRIARNEPWLSALQVAGRIGCNERTVHRIFARARAATPAVEEAIAG